MADGQYQLVNIVLSDKFCEEHEDDADSCVCGNAKEIVQELADYLEVPIKIVINQKVKDEMRDKINRGASYSEVQQYGCFPPTPEEYISGHDRFRTNEMSDKDINAKLQEILKLWDNFEATE